LRITFNFTKIYNTVKQKITVQSLGGIDLGLCQQRISPFLGV